MRVFIKAASLVAVAMARRARGSKRALSLRWRSCKLPPFHVVAERGATMSGDVMRSCLLPILSLLVATSAPRWPPLPRPKPPGSARCSRRATRQPAPQSAGGPVPGRSLRFAGTIGDPFTDAHDAAECAASEGDLTALHGISRALLGPRRPIAYDGSRTARRWRCGVATIRAGRDAEGAADQTTFGWHLNYADLASGEGSAFVQDAGRL